MATGAKVHDTEAIRLFRAALVKFTENVSIALVDGEHEVTRKINWLQSEADQFWQAQVRKWQEEVSRAIDAVRQKRIFKDSLGRQQSTVDEEKHLKICRLRLDEAETKLKNTRRWARDLQREHLLLRGGIQRLATMASADLPQALAVLDRVTASLQAYMDAAPTEVASSAEGTAAGSGMTRAPEPANPAETPAQPASGSESAAETAPEQPQPQDTKPLNS